MTRLTVFIFLFPLTVFGQKFMIENGDTLPFKKTVKIYQDTIHLEHKTIFPGDTGYLIPCQTFEKVDGQIINMKTADCRPTGFWVIESDDGLIKKGNYNEKGKKTGTWKTYDQNGQLKEEIEYASVANDTYILKEINYKDGQAEIVSEKTWFASFYLRNVLLIAVVIMGAFFSRVPLNMTTARRQYGQKPVFWFPFVTSFDKAMRYMIGTMFTFWWTNLKPENKSLGRLSNFLSIIALGGFFGLLIGLGISGELK